MSSFTLKLLGIITMCIDHIGLMFFSSEIIFRLIGRIAMPIFAFQLAVGFYHSKNKEKHILRMLLFAIISQIPFSIYLSTALSESTKSLNIGFTFVLGLLGMYVLNKFEKSYLKIIGLLYILFFSTLIPVDYGVFGVLLCIVFYLFRDSQTKTVFTGSLVILSKILIEKALWRVPTLYALVPIAFYNEKKGIDNKFTKYLFYIFYPLHLIVFCVIRNLC